MKPDFVGPDQRKTLRVRHDAEEYDISPVRFASKKQRFGGDFARFRAEGSQISLHFRLYGGESGIRAAVFQRVCAINKIPETVVPTDTYLVSHQKHVSHKKQ
jgi:hypothetical protein